jgi:hypothetical protein
MLTQSDEERERYDAGRQSQLDYDAAMRAARLQGQREGQHLAHVEEKVNTIRFCERLLKRPQTPRERLAALSLDELTLLEHALKDLTLRLPAAGVQDPPVLPEELNILTQSQEERERYEARRKAQLDYNTAMKAARLQGQREGRDERRRLAIDIIHFCERLLERPQTPPERLASLSLEELTCLAVELKDLTRSRAEGRSTDGR